MHNCEGKGTNKLQLQQRVLLRMLTEEAKTEAKQSESLAAKALPKPEENTGYRFHR